MTVNKDGTVSTQRAEINANDLLITIDENDVLPIKFKTAKKLKFLLTAENNISSLWGLPDKCQSLTISSLYLTSLKYCTPILDDLFINAPRLKSFDCEVNVKELKINNMGNLPISDIGKHFKISQKLIVGTGLIKQLYKEPVLSLCKLNVDISFQVLMSDRNKPEIQEVVQVLRIVNEHRFDIIACQRALIENDLDEYAEF